MFWREGYEGNSNKVKSVMHQSKCQNVAKKKTGFKLKNLKRLLFVEF